MAQKNLHSTCSDCVVLVQCAATPPSNPDDQALHIPYNKEYQSRLLANVVSSTCHMCTLLLTTLPQLSRPFQSGEERIIVVFSRPHDFATAEIELNCHNGADGKRVAYGTLSIQEAGQGIVTIVESPQTWSLETMNCIRSWLEICTSYHEICSRPKESFKLPLRLIDVNAANQGQSQWTSDMTLESFDQLRLENKPDVRVVSTTSLSPDTEYLTLSHRWGSPPSILLTQSTSFLLDEDISPHLLKCEKAVVFQHAIHVTRALGFRYIWIDSLCIMQDDVLERTTEIMRMDSIYSNCKLNISAAEADISRGLVFDRNLKSVNPCISTAKVQATQEDVQFYVFHDMCSLLTRQKPLHIRGWVFQERTLARRKIHFTKDQVFWECWSLEANETLPCGIHAPRSNDFDKSIGLRSKSFDAQKTRSRWYDLVEEYSWTTCTYTDDRLLAISALAKSFCSALHADPSEYLAGMWKHDLPLCLDWLQDIEETVTGASRPAENELNQEYQYAPSWSWASIMAPVTFVAHQGLLATTEVVDIEVQRRSPNLFDGTTLCRLRLRGPLCKFRRYIQEGIAWIRVTGDTSFEEFRESTERVGSSWCRDIDLNWDTARGPFRRDECFLLQLKAKPEEEHIFRVRGLVLLRAAHRGTYRRFGHFTLSSTYEYPGSILEAAFEGCLNTLSAEDYLETDPDGRYLFDLV